MTAKPPFSHLIRVAHLSARKPNPVQLQPDADARRAIADDLGLLDLPELAFDGRIEARGNDAWELIARLTARVVQPCVVTLAPVETALDEDVRRVFSPHVSAPEEDEVEMSDDEIEPLGQFIDAGAQMVEALSLALPLYPRADGAELTDAPEPQPEAEEDRQRPFAGLDALLNKRPQ